MIFFFFHLLLNLKCSIIKILIQHLKGDSLNTKSNMIIANGRIVTPDIKFCNYNNTTHKYDIIFNNGKVYSYNYNNVTWLKKPIAINPNTVKITHGENELFNIEAIYLFENSYRNYYHICFDNGKESDYLGSDLQIDHSCLDNSTVKSVLEYFKQIADLAELKADDGTKLLSKQYEKIDYLSTDSALASYLSPNDFSLNSFNKNIIPIFPFGCNASQYKAVKNALENQVSVIEGPPGTGKTQTILNIIANLLVDGKSVQIVSNNNSATLNVFEKLNSDKYNLAFLVAPLGSSKNKNEFIKSQMYEYPNISSWKSDENISLQQVQECSNELKDIFEKQERLANARIELQNLTVEKEHFDVYISETTTENEVRIKKNIKSFDLMTLWQECLYIAEKESKISFWFKLKGLLKYRIFDWKFYDQDISKIITAFQKMYYTCKGQELTNEISSLENELKVKKAYDLMTKLTDMSMSFLKNKLFLKYGNSKRRKKFSIDDLWKNPQEFLNEYPIVLSTTFSSRSSLGKNAKFDYIIMDEASQVDVTTGALALSCAKNAVIVGDTKQLPNVITEDIKNRANSIFESFNISSSYNYTENSFLQSICRAIPNVSNTLLREHYRCHPKIINFCNEKFYGGNLVIMTKDNGENDVLSVIKTVEGKHTRERMNLRQIEVVKDEVLPKLNFESKEIGIIAPYNNQVNKLKSEIDNQQIDIATIHKFQGREKDAIIITTVDDEVTEFSDDPFMLNVAVSRAKKELCLVVSGNKQPNDSNIGDLVSYIEYNNFTVTESKIYSVFDFLYTDYTKSRFEFLQKHKRISEYDSENLMFALIENVLEEQDLIGLSVICHQPLNMLIRDPQLLNDEECKYAMNSATHLDFLIYSRISKKPVLAVEVDGYHYHKAGTKQAERDLLKNHILDLYKIPYVRFATNGSREKEILTEKLKQLS